MLSLLLAVPATALAGINGVDVVRKLPAQPVTTPTADAAGNLFGTSSSGGAYGVGFIYELTPPNGDRTKWSFQKLHDFDSASVSRPMGRLATDNAGNLYGVSYGGGSMGVGALYELRKPAQGMKRWQFTLLHSFRTSPSKDGHFPVEGVTIGPDGTIYGTTFSDGEIGLGTVYSLSSADPSGNRTYKIIHRFHGYLGPNDGSHPFSNLLLDASGNLFGTTADPEIANGTVFELSPHGAEWRLKTLYYFEGGSDGTEPLGTLTRDNKSHIFGTTLLGGNAGGGTVFELSPPVGGSHVWSERAIASFGYNAADVLQPVDGVALDPQGRVFGATQYGGGVNPEYCFGGVFRLTPPTQGATAWTKDVLLLLGEPHTTRFGCNAAGSLTPLVNGKFYGVNGQDAAPGVFYSVTP